MPIGRHIRWSTTALTFVAVSGFQAGFAADGSTATPETVVVTATRSATTLANIPESIRVVTSDQIQDAPALGLDDVLRDLPGLTLNDIGPDVGHPTAYNESMRGLPTTETRMLVMVGGVPVSDPFFGYIQWNRSSSILTQDIYLVR
jgi:outer membrane receptor for ferrienterochelin and colicin